MLRTGAKRRRRVFRGSTVVAVVLASLGLGAVGAGAAPGPVAVPAARSASGVTGFIVGGDPVAPGEFPALAAIMVDEPHIPARERLLCSGTVVAPRWILTAGHCSIEVLIGEPLVVQVGARDLGARGAQTVAINRAVVHAKFFNHGVGYDVALMHTAATVTAPMARLATSADSGLEVGGHQVTAAGWGLTKQLGIEQSPGFNAKPPRRARAVDIPIVDDATCASTFADFAPGYFVPASDVCAGGPGKDACYGDSGGPLYARDPQGALVQIGITSRGAGCATKLFPGIFTDVERVGAWIHRYTTQPCTNRVKLSQDPGFPDEPVPNGLLYVC